MIASPQRATSPSALPSALVATLVLLVAATLLHPALAAASTGQRAANHRPAPDRQKGHAPFGDCPARAVHMTVTVLNPVARTGVPINVVASVTNTGPTPCHYSAGGPPTNSHVVRPGTMGPCGAMTLAAYRPVHHEIWPGSAAYSCPLLVSTALPTNQTVRVLGSWPQIGMPGRSSTALIPVQVPPGRYWLVVDGRFRFRIRVR